MEAVSTQRGSRAAQLRRDLIACTTDGCLFCFMVGIGESYFALFMLASGQGKVAAGLITTVPLLLGALLGLLAPIGVRRVGTHRKFIILTAVLQGLSFAPLAVMAGFGNISVLVAFASATLYWAGGLSAAAAWNTWIGMIIPARIRSHYFGRRATLCHFATIAGLAAGGILLETSPGGESPLFWFAVLFGLAGLCRLACIGCFAAQTETGPVPDHHREIGPGELLRRLRHGRDGRFLIYMILMQIGVQVAQPYFVPFVREALRFNYVDYLLLIAASFVAKAITQPMWGAFAHRKGALRLLWIGGLGLIPLTLLWAVPIFVDWSAASVFWYLIAAQLVSGTLWAAYEQAIFLVMFDAIREEERTSLWSAFSVGNSAAMVGGSLIGAWLLGESAGPAAYSGAFILSMAIRLSTVIYLIRAHDLLEPPKDIIVESESVRPGAGSLDRPILSAMKSDPER